MLSLPYEWLSSGHGEQLWGQGTAYKRVAYARVPGLPVRDGSFEWLSVLPPGVQGMPFVYECEPDLAAVTAHLRRLSADATARSLTIPTAFVRFVSDPGLHGRVATTTHSYFELGEELLPVPGHSGPERLLMFMYDLGLGWYLLLEPGAQHRIVCASGTPPEEPLVDLRVCADSFEEFIERFWIESTLWFAEQLGTPIEGPLRDYLEAARRST